MQGRGVISRDWQISGIKEMVENDEIKTNISLHLELLQYYPVNLQLWIKNFDVCNETQKERTHSLDELISWKRGAGGHIRNNIFVS